MKRFAALFLALAAAACTAVSVHAADCTFRAGPAPDYYRSTDCADVWETDYRFGGPNRTDFEIPDIAYGLSREFRERSSAGGAVRYGRPCSAGGPVRVPYRPAPTASDFMRRDGSIGTVSVPRAGIRCRVFEGTGAASMRKGAGHCPATGLWEGNIGLFGHNRGGFFGRLRYVREGDTVVYETAAGTRTYEVVSVRRIAASDFSCLNGTGDDRITLVTCVEDQPALRLCVQAAARR